MTLRIWLGGLMIASCLGGLAFLVVHVLAHDQDAAEQELARDRLQSLSQAARGLGADLARIGDDLALAGTLPGERELRAITTVKRAYLVLEAKPTAGATVYVSAAGAPPDVVALATPVIDHMLDAARRTPGELHISAGLSSNDNAAAWYRVFARQTASDAPGVAAVVDMRQLVAAPEALRVGTSRLLVLSAHGVPAPASDASLADALRDERSPELQELVAAARARRVGIAILDGDVAAALGLPRARAVAAAVPVPIDSGPPWILAVVSSTDTLEARHDALVRRMSIGGLLGLALVVFSTLYVVRNARRAAALGERLRHADLLAHLTEKAEKILDHIPSGVLALDERGLVTAANHWFSERAIDPVDRTLDGVFADAPREDVQAVLDLVASAKTSGAPRALARAQLRLFGDTAHLTIRAVPLANALHDVACLVVIEDVSPLQQAEDRLLRSEKLATAGQLSAGIAHELGTPLNVARGRAEMVLARLDGEDADAANQRLVIEQIDHVTRLIQQLLDYVRPQPLRVEAVDVAAVLPTIADLLRAHAASRGVGLRVELDDGFRAVRADPSQLQQVLVNLVMNAIDACERGGRVVLRAKPHAGGTALEVSDDGHGIAPEDRAHVFDPFFTTKKRGRGTGLGLWVVAQVARAHGAEIEVASAPGDGTTVRILWPREHGEAAA